MLKVYWDIVDTHGSQTEGISAAEFRRECADAHVNGLAHGCRSALFKYGVSPDAEADALSEMLWRQTCLKYRLGDPDASPSGHWMY